MKLTQLISEDDAVSPVIGVILMVAITVILAAVIGAFVLGLGGNQNVTPQVTFDTAENDTTVVFTHSSGDTIQDAEEKLTLAGPLASGETPGDLSSDASNVTSNEFSVGDKINAALDTGTASNGDEVRVVFSAEGSSDTSALTTYTLTNQ
jgi:flagellin-like protein